MDAYFKTGEYKEATEEEPVETEDPANTDQQLQNEE